MIDNNEIKGLKKRRNKLLGVVFISIIVVLTTSLTLYFLRIPSVDLTLIIILLLIALLVIIFIIKPKLMYTTIQYRYLLLLSQSNKPYKVNEVFDLKWINKITLDGYSYSYKGNQVDILYKVSKPLERSAFLSNSLLEIITIFKDETLDFYDDLLHNEYKKIWDIEQAKNKISKQVIIQIKKYHEFNDDIKNDLDRIISFREGKNHLVTINCGFFEKTKSFYFLHSNTYAPSLYYKHGVDTIKRFIK